MTVFDLPVAVEGDTALLGFLETVHYKRQVGA